MAKNNRRSILDMYPEYQAVIGIEVHVQLQTKSKIFCSCSNKFGSQPNTNICRICTGMLGSLPVINKQAVNYAIKAGIATKSIIAKVTEFSRKHYSYPDLPKNYQTTQDNKPICFDGHIMIKDEQNQDKKIRILRIHMEEDAGKNIHKGDMSYVDLNRAGTPLIEIVTEPDISSANEAVAYLEKLQKIVRYAGISSANMEEGSFRADINISVNKKTETEFGTRVELKNINSFKFIHSAIEFELERQIMLKEQGVEFEQQTRLWNEKKNETVFMRSKESAQDYRYFTEPDLPLIIIDQEWVDRMEREIPELPDEKEKRFCQEFGLSQYEAEILCEQIDLANFFEAAAKKSKLPKKVCNWILRDLLGYLKESKETLENIKITPDTLAELVIEIDKGVLNNSIAKEVFQEMLDSGKYPSIIIQEKGIEQVGSEAELKKIVQEIIAKNPKQVETYKSGNERIFGFFVGQAMKQTKGQANPKILSDLFEKALK